MNTAKNVIKLFLDPDSKDSIILRFQELMTSSPSFSFMMAEINQDNDHVVTDMNDPAFFPLKLYTTSNIIVMVSGIVCGKKYMHNQTMVDLLKFCGFNVDDELAEVIMNANKINITLWKGKMRRK